VLPAHAQESPSTTPRNPSHDITDYMRLDGDQVVVVPNGRYRAGDVRKAHAETGGKYGGWLVLVAESKGGVVVDMSDGGLTFKPQASRIMMVGFRFENGSIDIQGNHISFWYTDHTFPAEVWADQAPDREHPERGRFRAPRTIYAHDDTSDHITFNGSDLHDASSGIIMSKNTDLELHGVEMWNLSDKGLDPNDVTHSDAIGGVAGESKRLKVTDSWLKGRVVLIDAPANLEGGGPHTDFLFEDTWVSDSPSAGFIFTSRKPDPPLGVFGRRVNVRSWGHKNGIDRLDIVDGEHLKPNEQPDFVDVKDVDIKTTAPPDGAESPSARWRRKNPYDSWPTFFGLPPSHTPDTAKPGQTPPGRLGAPTVLPARDDGTNAGVLVAVVAGAIVLLGALTVLVVRGRRRRRAPVQASGTADANSTADSTFTSSATVPDVDAREPKENSSSTR
jgi:hypothetical protein